MHLTLLELGFDADGCCYGEVSHAVEWDRERYEYLASVNWAEGHDPIIEVQDRLQRNDQVLTVRVVIRSCRHRSGSRIHRRERR